MVTQLLIADSEPLVRERGRGYFTNRGYAVETAADALQCLDRQRRRPPDVLVLEANCSWAAATACWLACAKIVVAGRTQSFSPQARQTARRRGWKPRSKRC